MNPISTAAEVEKTRLQRTLPAEAVIPKWATARRRKLIMKTFVLNPAESLHDLNKLRSYLLCKMLSTNVFFVRFLRSKRRRNDPLRG
jgi:hypothetical protein